MKRQQILSTLVVLYCCFCLVTAAQATTVTKTFPAGETGNLVVKIQSGDIRIETGKSEVRVTARGIEPSDQDNLDIAQVGTDVYVNFEPNMGYSDAKFEIEVPAGFNLDLKTSGGDIHIAGFLAGDLTATTSGGDIVMDDVEGKVVSKTAGGDIRAGNVGGAARFETAGGDIAVTNVSGALHAATAGGDIEVGDVGSRLIANTAGGDIKLGNVGGEAMASTAGGDVEVGEVNGSATLRTAGGDIRLLSASGQVEAKTAGGDLHLKNVTGSIEGKTAGGDIRAELIPGGEGPSSLQSSGGDLVLALPPSASAAITAKIKISGNWEKKEDEFGITSEFGAVDVVKDQSKREIRAQFSLGGGGESITLSTTNGNISINKLR